MYARREFVGSASYVAAELPAEAWATIRIRHFDIALAAQSARAALTDRNVTYYINASRTESETIFGYVLHIYDT